MNRVYKFILLVFMFVVNIGFCYAFENDISGSTGWSIIDLSIRSNADDTSNVIGTVVSGEPFLILSEDGNYWKIKYSGNIGYVPHDYCMINLPDVIPSIKYDITNAYSSIFRSAGYDISGVTGVQLYSAGKVMNYKIGREEFIVPSLYSTAKKIYEAQRLALDDGYSLLIYDSYRPTSVDKLVTDNLEVLYNSNSVVKDKIDWSTGLDGTRYYWGTGWFVAKSLSTHNVASAIDVSLYNLSSNSEGDMPTVIHELSSDGIKYYSSSVSKIPANFSVGMLNSPDGQRLDSYMRNVGMTDLASEWWHYQDQAGYERAAAAVGHAIGAPGWAGCDFQVTSIVSESSFSYEVLGNYYVNDDLSIIYTGTETNADTIFSNIELSGADSSKLSAYIQDNKYIIKYFDKVIKEYTLVNYSSDVFDLSKSYLVGSFDYIRDNINLNGVDLNLNIANNHIEIKYQDITLHIYDFVNYFSSKYDLSNSSILVEDNDIDSFLSNISCVGCSSFVYDGNSEVTGSFGDNYYLNIMYGSELVKSFMLTYHVNGISLNSDSIMVNLNNTYQLSASISPLNSYNKNLVWESSDSSVASVDSNGLVTANKAGSAVITVSSVDGGFSDTCNVTVLDVQSYTITFVDGNNTYNYDYAPNVSISFPNLTKPGYTLVGWSYNGSIYKLNDVFYMPSSNISMTAIWEKKIPAISNYIVSGSYLTGFSFYTDVSSIDLGIDPIYEIRFFNNKNNLKSSGYVATGDMVRIYLDNSVVSEYKIIVKGDVNGDGRISVSDISKLYKKLKLKNNYVIDECYVIAGNVNGDNVISVSDVSKLYKYLKGKISRL